MVGKYCIKLKSPRIVYDFEIDRKYTVIQGDTSSGKTKFCTMIDMVDNRVITLSCVDEGGKSCQILTVNGHNLDFLLKYNGCILVIDEEVVGTMCEIVPKLEESDNYFIIIARDIPRDLNATISRIGTEKGYNSSGKPCVYNKLALVQ